MRLRTYLRASLLYVLLAAVIITFSVVLNRLVDWRLADEVLVTVGGTLLLFPLLLLLRLGRSGPLIQSDGTMISRLRSGARIFFFIVFGGTAILVGFVVFLGLRAGDDEIGAALFLAALGLGFAYICASAMISKIAWNDTTISAVGWVFATRSHSWKDIKLVYDEEFLGPFSVLLFSTDLKVRVSRFHEAHDEIVEFARGKLTNA